MGEIKIIGDSTCDLSEELQEKYGIPVIPLVVTMGEDSYQDGVDITPDELYRWSDRTGMTPQTSSPIMETILNILRPFDRGGMSLIFIGISEEMSVTCQSIRLAGEELRHAKLYVINSKSLSTGIALQLVKAAELAAEGRAAEDIIQTIEAMQDKVQVSFVVDTLVYLHRGGRCNAVTALLANTLKLKPKIVVKDGKMGVEKKYRGQMKQVIRRYTEDLMESIMSCPGERVFITHSGCCEELIAEVQEELEGLQHFKEIHVTRTGSVIASHCGPNTLGVVFCR